MPLNSRNTHGFFPRLYAGQLATVRLLKRQDDQAESQVVALILYRVRLGRIHKTGEPLAGDMTSNERRTIYFPRSELDRVGVAHLNALDRIVDADQRYWQPESDTNIEVKLFENVLNVECLRFDPPNHVVPYH